MKLTRGQRKAILAIIADTHALPDPFRPKAGTIPAIGPEALSVIGQPTLEALERRGLISRDQAICKHGMQIYGTGWRLRDLWMVNRLEQRLELWQEPRRAA